MIDDELPEQVSIDVTPLATIALILVIIFISSASTWVQPVMQLELPRAATSESKSRQNLTISLNEKGALAIDDAAVSWAALSQGVRLGLRDNPDGFVIIRADRRAPYGMLTRAMRAARRAGARDITIATEQKPRSGQ